ncbi:MAG TPA: DUF2508 family protein [Thermoanaerobacterales bacterium]|uniref:DUF2508 family protein n=1 Tax=Tepidanaerobacter sp. GT38 TaxID=2722793 RepID=UPI0017E5579D|nr:DUF2508 family protein [Tepidanaerobacter sp. GT38]MCG1011354.1 DUF2508 family protein [Tepidanaerobacter sp. GT38]HHY41383.1 DUF2508 family protein [Thermoanaerobacterales bacterium]
MTQSLGSSKDREANLIEEIEKALLEINLSEKAFQWAQNDPDAVDLAIAKKQAAMQHYDFLIKQAKKAGLKLDKGQLIAKILKQ